MSSECPNSFSDHCPFGYTLYHHLVSLFSLVLRQSKGDGGKRRERPGSDLLELDRSCNLCISPLYLKRLLRTGWFRNLGIGKVCYESYTSSNTIWFTLKHKRRGGLDTRWFGSRTLRKLKGIIEAIDKKDVYLFRSIRINFLKLKLKFFLVKGDILKLVWRG